MSMRGCGSWVLLLAIAGALPVATSAVAQELISSRLRDADRNGDGLLQRDEVPIALLADFARIDEDGDGVLDSFEVWQYDQEVQRRVAREAEAAATAPRQRKTRAPASERPTMESYVQSRDRDGDGRMSLDEAPRSLYDVVLRLDRNGDHALDLEEARAADRRMAGEAPRQRREGGLEAVVRRMDTDGDGILQWKEAPLRVQREFERFDTNGDRAIDAAEAEAFDAAEAAAEKGGP
jgi:hypothetical protein